MNDKSCRTCGRRFGDQCNLSGNYYTTERKYPTKCGMEYDGWIPRKGIFERMIEAIFGVDNEETK